MPRQKYLCSNWSTGAALRVTGSLVPATLDVGGRFASKLSRSSSLLRLQPTCLPALGRADEPSGKPRDSLTRAPVRRYRHVTPRDAVRNALLRRLVGAEGSLRTQPHATSCVRLIPPAGARLA
jgi:hypothetical protein